MRTNTEIRKASLPGDVVTASQLAVHREETSAPVCKLKRPPPALTTGEPL